MAVVVKSEPLISARATEPWLHPLHRTFDGARIADQIFASDEHELVKALKLGELASTEMVPPIRMDERFSRFLITCDDGERVIEKFEEGKSLGTDAETVYKRYFPAPAAANDNEPGNEIVNPPSAPTIDPFNVSTHGGVLQQITEWILDTARVPVPEFATISALAFLGAFFGRRYITPTDLGLNVYMVGVAGPSFGKDHARGAIETLADDSGMSWLIGPGDVTSDSAIEKAIRRHPCHVMPMDEFGALLQGVTGNNATSWTRTIRKSILELYSRSTKRWTGKEKADDKKDSSPVFFPTVSLLGFSTPTDFYAGITEQNFKDGFIARLTIIEVKGAPKRKQGRSIRNTPAGLVDVLKNTYMLAPSNDLQRVAAMDARQKPHMHLCKWGDGAEERWLEIENWQVKYLDSNPEKEGIIGRAAEQTQKLATLRAISRNPAAPVVEVEDVDFGYAIVQRSIDTIEEGAAKYMVGSESEALRNAILLVVEKAGTKGIAYSDLVRAKGVRSAKPHELEASLKWLEDGERLRMTRKLGTTAKGRAGTRYLPVKISS